MAKPEKKTPPAPISIEEIGAFLVWLYSQAGHSEYVDAWRQDTGARPAKKPQED